MFGKMRKENRIDMRQTGVDKPAACVDTLESRSDVARSLNLDKSDEAGERFELRREDVEEGCGEDVHSLDVGRAGSRCLL